MEYLDHLCARASRASPVTAGSVEQVLPRAQLLEAGRFDRHAVDVFADRERRGDDVPAEHGGAAGIRGQQRAEDSDQRRLAAAVGPEYPRHAAGLDDQVHLVQGNLGLPFTPPPGRAGFALAAPEGFLDAEDLYSNAHDQLLKYLWKIKRTEAVPNNRTVLSVAREESLEEDQCAVIRRQTPPSMAKVSSVMPPNARTPLTHGHTPLGGRSGLE